MNKEEGRKSGSRGTPTNSHDHIHEVTPLHQLAIARQRQGLSQRCVAKRLSTTIAKVRDQEQDHAGLRLSELYAWQAALEVPLHELLVEPGDSLSPHVLDRARMLRVMKTVQAIRRKALLPNVRRLAENLVGQMVDLMPELREVAAWPAVGKRRSSDEMGRIVEHPLPESWVRDAAE